MSIKISDRQTGAELWRTEDCAAYVKVTATTWAGYRQRRLVPAPVETLGKSAPLWDAEEIKQWHSNRPKAGKKRASQTRHTAPTHH